MLYIYSVMHTVYSAGEINTNISVCRTETHIYAHIDPLHRDFMLCCTYTWRTYQQHACWHGHAACKGCGRKQKHYYQEHAPIALCRSSKLRPKRLFTASIQLQTDASSRAAAWGVNTQRRGWRCLTNNNKNNNNNMIYVFYKSRDLMGVKEGLWSANQPCEVDRCVRVGGNVHILPLPEETAASDTFPRSSDGARSPQTSEEDQNTYFED